MYKKILFYLIVAALLAALQISFISSLPAGIGNLNLVLVCLAYSIGLSKNILAWCLALLAGFIFDLVSFAPFGLYLLGMFFAIAAVYFLHLNFLTNQSLYTYITLTIAGVAVFRIWEYGFYAAGALLMDIENYLDLNAVFWQNQFLALVLNALLAALVFYFIAFIGQRLTPVFLIKRKK